MKIQEMMLDPGAADRTEKFWRTVIAVKSSAMNVFG